MPQELTSMVGRYGKHLSGSDVQQADGSLESLDFDDDTAELLGLNDIEELISEFGEAASGEPSSDVGRDSREDIDDTELVDELEK